MKARVRLFGVGGMLLVAGLLLGYVPAEVTASNEVASRETAGGQVFCPVMTENRIDPAVSVEYRGQQVFFCCTFCRAQFLKDPEAYVDHLPQFASLSHEDSASGEITEPIHAEHEHGDHDHGEGLIAYLGRWHPVVVHFPIALTLAAILAELLQCSGRTRSLGPAVTFCLVTAMLGATAAVLLGGAAEGSGHRPAELAVVLERHELAGYISLACLVAATALRLVAGRSARLQWAFRVVLLAAGLAVMVAGYLGGSLVYGIGHLAW